MVNAQVMPKCDSCDSAYINGIYAHETGCPNSRKKYINDTWVTMYQCDVCGYYSPEGEVCCDSDYEVFEDWDD